jgi:hypothetical protein
LLSVSLCPCRRSPPASVGRRGRQSATAPAACAFPVAGSAAGAAHWRGHRCVRLRYSLATRPHPAEGAVERLQRVGFPSPCAPSDRALAFPLVGFPPTEHARLRWTHLRTGRFPSSASSAPHVSIRRGCPISQTTRVICLRPHSSTPHPRCAAFPGTDPALYPPLHDLGPRQRVRCHPPPKRSPCHLPASTALQPVPPRARCRIVHQGEAWAVAPHAVILGVPSQLRT